MSSGRTSALRLRQGLVLLAGSIVFAVLVGGSAEAFYWTPLGIGLVYLAASIAGGREGGYWSGALVLCGWGAAVAYARHARPDLDLAGLYLAGAGLGATAAIAAQRAGVRSDSLGAAGTVALVGAVLAVSGHWSQLTQARTYALLVGAVGLINVVWALVGAYLPAGREGPG